MDVLRQDQRREQPHPGYDITLSPVWSGVCMPSITLVQSQPRGCIASYLQQWAPRSWSVSDGKLLAAYEAKGVRYKSWVRDASVLRSSRTAPVLWFCLCQRHHSKMRAFSLSLLYTGLLVVGAAVFGCHGKSSDCVDASIIAHTGEPLGTEIRYSNGESRTLLPELRCLLTHVPVTIYVAKPDPENPRTKPRAGIVLIYLSDIFGLGIPENKLCVSCSVTARCSLLFFIYFFFFQDLVHIPFGNVSTDKHPLVSPTATPGRAT